MDLDFLAPYVEAALDRAGIGDDVTLSGMRFGIDFPAHQLALRADNVRLAAPDGAPLANLPQTSMSVALGPLLQGRLAPTSLTVEHPVLHLRRDAGGTVSIDLAPGEQRAPDGRRAPVALDRLLSPEAGDPASALPLHVAIRGATVLIDDARSGLTWRADPVDIAIERGPDGISGDLSLTLPLGDGRPELHAAFRYVAGKPESRSRPVARRRAARRHSGAGSRTGAAAARSRRRCPANCARGSISPALRPRPRRVDIAIGNGRLRSELLPQGGIAIEGGELHAAYDPEGRELRLDTLRLDLGGGSELAIAGAVADITPELIAAAVRGAAACGGHGEPHGGAEARPGGAARGVVARFVQPRRAALGPCERP